MASADGGLQALRRELFQPVPGDVTDDFFLTTCASVAGQQIVFAERARVIATGAAIALPPRACKAWSIAASC